MTIEAGVVEDSTSVLIGDYCSISHDVNFILNLDHSDWEISTYPLELFNLEWKIPPNIKR